MQLFINAIADGDVVLGYQNRPKLKEFKTIIDIMQTITRNYNVKTALRFFFLALGLFSFCALKAQKAIKIYELASYGILPDTKENTAPRLAAVLEKIKSEITATDSLVLSMKKGKYDFYPDAALERKYYISNHDQDNPKSVGIALEHFINLTLDAQGSDFIFHGRMLPIALVESEQLTIKNLHIDFETPHICQAVVVENDTLKQEITFAPAPWVNYRIQDSVFLHSGLGWEQQPKSGIAFEPQTKRIVYNTGDIQMKTSKVEEISPRIIKAHGWKNSKLIPGTVLAMRIGPRPTPGVFVHKGKNIKLENIKVHYAEGMGLLAQLTENIHLKGFDVALRGADDPRYFTAQADATHFSGCKGVIISEDGLYENMMDDAINIHGTYLKMIARRDSKTVVAKYMHGQSYGFDWADVGDTVQFIRSGTMELWEEKNVIHAIRPLRKNLDDPIKEFYIEFEEPLTEEIDPDFTDVGIENLTWTPAVVFTNNLIRNNRARGALFSTPKPTRVENNIFDHTSGCAILLCGDSNGWYETGSCRDVTIRKNTFINALTSMYQFTNAVISIYPEIPNLDKQEKYFHGGIRIEDNDFITFDQPLLYAKSVEDIRFSENRIQTNRDFPAFHWNKERILLERVKEATVSGNTIDGKQVNMLKH